MQTVEASGQTKIGAVVHDEPDTRCEARSEFAGLFEYAPGVAGLVAILEQGAASGGESLGGREHSGSVGETRCVENRVESRKLHSSEITVETRLAPEAADKLVWCAGVSPSG